MAKKPTAATKSAMSVAITLAMIVAAGAEGLYTMPEVHNPMVAAGTVEINPSMVDENGAVATRATQKGIDEVTAAPTETKSASAVKSAYAIDNDIAMPTASGRGRTSNTYPFDNLEVGQSFFVANSEDKPNAAKSLASTVSSATARYAEEIPGETKTNRKGETVPAVRETRKFMVRAVDETAAGRGKGARVWRTA